MRAAGQLFRADAPNTAFTGEIRPPLARRKRALILICLKLGTKSHCLTHYGQKKSPLLDCVGCFTSATTLFQRHLTNAALHTFSLALGLESYDSRGVRVALCAPVKRVKNTGTLDLVGTWLIG